MNKHGCSFWFLTDLFLSCYTRKITMEMMNMIKDCYCREKGLKQFFGTLLQNVPHQFAHHFENRIVQSFHVSRLSTFYEYHSTTKSVVINRCSSFCAFLFNQLHERVMLHYTGSNHVFKRLKICFPATSIRIIQLLCFVNWICIKVIY